MQSLTNDYRKCHRAIGEREVSGHGRDIYLDTIDIKLLLVEVLWIVYILYSISSLRIFWQKSCKLYPIPYHFCRHGMLHAVLWYIHIPVIQYPNVMVHFHTLEN